MTSPQIGRDGSKDDIFKTQRLLLRPIQASDSDAVYAMRSDPRVLFWTTPDTREKCDEWLYARLNDELSPIHAVSLLEQPDQVIGVTGGRMLPEIGYTFLPSAWGKGCATEALQGWIRWYWNKWPDGYPLLDEGDKHCLKAETGPGGEASERVLKKCGFRWYEGRELSEDEKGVNDKGTRVVLEQWRLERPPSW